SRRRQVLPAATSARSDRRRARRPARTGCASAPRCDVATMRLVSLRVEQLPGLTQPLYLQDITAGVTVVVGPNASGKSSLVRALMAVLYPREHKGVLRVEAEFRS